MGKFKEIKITLESIDMVDIILTILLLISIIALANFKLENEKLLKQNDLICSDLNEIKFENELLYNANEELKEEYERVINLINSVDRYSFAKEFEEDK